jgi:hypothetical protein
VVRTDSRLAPGGSVGIGAVGDEVAVTDGAGVEVGVEVGVVDGASAGVACPDAGRVAVEVVETGEPGASPVVGVGVAVWPAGAACATPARPVNSPMLFGNASASRLAWWTNARRVIRRVDARFILVVRRITV